MIRRSPKGNRLAKDQEEYEALMKCHGDTIQWNLEPKRGLTAWVRNAKGS